MESSSARNLAAGSSAGNARLSDAVPSSLEQQPTVISGRAPLPVSPPPEEGVPGRSVSGVRLGQFELLECVGGGGMGRVYRAMDTALARIVAVKVLSREQAADQETLLRFRNEAQSAARLNHENIVQVYHVGEADGLPFIVFEFIAGQNLRMLVEQRGPLGLAEAISYTFQVAEALAHAAQRNVVHRDIKPSNVVVMAGGRVKLIDMGLARVQGGDPAGDLTASGVTLGTFDYISPEQARDPRTADVRSDIYSLGCTLFFTLAGQPPFPQGTVLQKLLQHQGEEPPDVRQFRPELPEEVSRLLRRMMAKDPRRRFQTAAELIAALVRLGEQTGLRPVAPGEAMWAPRRETPMSYLQRHLPWIAPVALLLGIVLVLDLLWTSPHPESRPVVRATAARPEASPSEVAAPGGAAPWDEEWWDEEPVSASPQPASPTAAQAKTQPEATPDSSPASVKLADPPSAEKSAAGPAPGSNVAAGPSPGEGLRPPVVQGELKIPGSVSSGALAGPSPVSAQPARGAANPEPSPTPPAAGPSKLARPGTLIVDGSGGVENRFATLAAACAKAVSGDVIVLRYNGRQEEKRPIALNNLKLTLRGDDGFQPVVAFRPSDPDPARYPRSMLMLAGSQVTLVNLALEMDIPKDLLADSWTLVELRQSEAVRLEKCSLTIRSGSDDQTGFHPTAAFFRLPATAEVEKPADPGTAAPASRSTVSLVNCIVRGEADVVRVHALRSVRFSWDNGLAVTPGRFLVADGGDRALPPGDAVRLELQHLTAAVRGGFCQVNQSESEPYPPPVAIECANSILIGSPASSLVEQTGVVSKEPGETHFSWNGERNFYEGFTNFWSVRRGDGESPPTSKTFDEWRMVWGPQREILPALHRVQWKKLPAADRPASTHGPDDYALAATTDAGATNPATGAASDAKDAGFLADAERAPPLAPAP